MALAQSSSSSSSSTFAGGEVAKFKTVNMEKVSHRQDICDVFAGFRNGTLELKDALQGKQLNVIMGAYEDAYFRYSPEEGIDPVYPGIAAVLMDELARRAGFTWRNSFGIFTEPKGAAYNESWTDVLLWSIDAYDLSVDWWARNLERLRKGTAYTQEWYDSSIILVGKKDKKQKAIKKNLGLSAYWNWTLPFSPEVWMTTVATVFLSGFVFQILEHLNGNRRGRKWFEWWSENLFLSAVNATQAYEYGIPKGLPSKLFCFSMALWSLILTATYTANLASLLVENQLDEIILIETIEAASFFGYPVCTWEGTNSDSYIAEKFPDVQRIQKKTLEEVYDGLNNGECVFAVEVIQQWLLNQHVERFNPNCDLEWVGNGRVIRASGAGFATLTDVGEKCTGLIRDVIDIHMEEMIAAGFLRDAWEVENSLGKEVDCSAFSSQQLLNAKLDAGRRRRKLKVTEKRLEEAKRYSAARRRLQDDYEYSRSSSRSGGRRRMKASNKSASSAGAVISEDGGGDSSQMELDSMIGFFFVHWGCMLWAIGMAMAKKYYRENYKLDGEKISMVQKEGQVVEEDNNDKLNQTEKIEESASASTKDDLRWQLEDLLYSMKQSKATMVKEQEELQWKIDKLKGVLEAQDVVSPSNEEEVKSL